MRLYHWLVRLAVLSALLLAAVPVAGWKWTAIRHH
jgi:hypothetical protein